MSTIFIYLSSASSILPAIAAVLLYRKADPVFFPFLFCMFLGFVNELLSCSLSAFGYNSIINNNFYVLIEALLFTWQFKEWEIYSSKEKSFKFRIALLVMLWLADTFIISGFFRVSTYFRIGYSFFLVLLSINLLNALLISERKAILRNSVFIICTSIIFFYTFKVFVEFFWLYGTGLSKAFRNHIYQIMVVLNIVCNLFYFIAVLWIPRKITFSTLF